MKDRYEQVQNSDKVQSFTKYYWGYQYRLAREVLAPMLRKKGVFKDGDTVIEIGCAEGGVLHAFAEAGAHEALGTDIEQKRLDRGEVISQIIDISVRFTSHDIISHEPLDNWKQKADLVLLRDVIEHLDDPVKALANIKKLIKPGGYLYVTFPPYHSPFGGHQQILENKWGKLPYIHLLPEKIFDKMIASGRPNDIVEVKRLHKIRMTPGKFANAANEAGFQIIKENYYLLRPVFKMKFGLPAINISGIAFLPFIKKFFSLETSYLLRA